MDNMDNLIKEYVSKNLFIGVVQKADSPDARIAFLAKVLELIIVKLYENSLLSRSDIINIFDTFKSK